MQLLSVCQGVKIFEGSANILTIISSIQLQWENHQTIRISYYQPDPKYIHFRVSVARSPDSPTVRVKTKGAMFSGDGGRTVDSIDILAQKSNHFWSIHENIREKDFH